MTRFLFSALLTYRRTLLLAVAAAAISVASGCASSQGAHEAPRGCDI
jgi:hypothetical protein